MQGLNFEIIVIKFFSEVLDVKYIIKTFKDIYIFNTINLLVQLML